MRVLVLGKTGSVTHWTEDCLAGFRAAEHEVRLGVTRNPKLNSAIEAVLTSRRIGVPRAALIARMVRRFRPDLILALVPHGIPLSILQHVAALPGRPPFAGWVGDLFAASDRQRANLFDLLAYTDSGLLSLHRQLGFRAPALFLPHAASPRIGTAPPDGPHANGSQQEPQRQNAMAFVANPTPHRRTVVASIRAPIHLYGPGWSAGEALSGHRIVDRRLGVEELAAVYRNHAAVLNIRHEGNVLAGLNQRHFDPAVVATPVLADEQADLPLCFEPGREVLVYRSIEELNDQHQRLCSDRAFAAGIGLAAQRRILAEHTYGKRLETLEAALS